MSSSYYGYWLVVFGIAIVGLAVTVNGLTTTNTENYFNAKEINSNALLASIDWAYYRDYNELKIDKEKYKEVIIRSMAEVNLGNDTIVFNVYNIYEAPPKASLEIIQNVSGREVVTRNDAIIEILAEEVSLNK